jgi:hypothetical protein
MRAFGWTYVIAYLTDALGSLAATLIPWLEEVSNALSLVVLGGSLAALVLAISGKLQPRKIFLVLAVFYFLLVASGLIVMVALVADFGTGILAEMPTIDFMMEHISWYPYFHWISLGLWLLLGLWATWSMAKSTVWKRRADDKERFPDMWRG